MANPIKLYANFARTSSSDKKMNVETLDARTFSPEAAQAIGQLLSVVWPNPKKNADYRTQQLIERGRAYSGPDIHAPRSLVVRENGQYIAHAAIVPRVIGTSGGELTVAGLAQVCSDPVHRGRGLGETVVRAVFELVDAGDFPCSLFQTSHQVRPFYEKLGSCVIENKIVNSLGEDVEANPFWDRVVMRYPATGEWPGGEIDLRGPGY